MSSLRHGLSERCNRRSRAGFGLPMWCVDAVGVSQQETSGPTCCAVSTVQLPIVALPDKAFKTLRPATFSLCCCTYFAAAIKWTVFCRYCEEGFFVKVMLATRLLGYVSYAALNGWPCLWLTRLVEPRVLLGVSLVLMKP